MIRERALKIVLVVVGLLFSALVYPMTIFFSREPALAMMLSVYATLGIFLLLAARNPSANRSLVAFTAWSSCSCRDYGYTGLPESRGARRTGRRRRPHSYRCAPGDADLAEAIKRPSHRSWRGSLGDHEMTDVLFEDLSSALATSSAVPPNSKVSKTKLIASVIWEGSRLTARIGK